MSSKWKTCNKCQFTSPDLNWDRDHYAKEGFWRLALITRGGDGELTVIPHICDKEKSYAPSNYNEPLIECTLCESYHACRGQFELTQHNNMWHPNGEIRYDYDFLPQKPKDEDFVSRKCQQCSKEKGTSSVFHAYPYGQVKDLKEVVCIRYDKV